MKPIVTVDQRMKLHLLRQDVAMACARRNKHQYTNFTREHYKMCKPIKTQTEQADRRLKEQLMSSVKDTLQKALAHPLGLVKEQYIQYGKITLHIDHETQMGTIVNEPNNETNQDSKRTNST